MSIRTCVVVALSEDIRKIAAASLHSRGMEVTSLASLGELPVALQKTAVCGILLEVITSLKASATEKKALQELVGFYPFGKFRLVDNHVLIAGKASLDQFVHECQQFNPRTLRKEPRKSWHLAIYLSADGTFEDPERAVTINVSDRGCFVYSIKEWSIGSRAWLRLLGTDAVMAGTVCWWDPWGNNKIIPGIGIKLDAAWVGV